METKQELRDKIKDLESKLEDQKIVLTKKQLQDFIKDQVKDNLRVEVQEGESYQYGGGYKTCKEIGVFWGDEQIYESTSF